MADDATIEATCPSCSRTYKLKPDFAGRKLACKKCGESFTVAAPEPPRKSETKRRKRDHEADDEAPRKKASSRDDDEAPRKKASSKDDDEAPRKKTSSKDDDEAPRKKTSSKDDDEAPKRKGLGTTRRKKLGSRSGDDGAAAEPASSPEPAETVASGIVARLRAKALALALGFALGAVACVGLGLEEGKLAAIAKPVARPVACAELAEKGPGDNAHVRLTDFVTCQDYVGQERDGALVQAYVPVVPVGSPYHLALVRAAEQKSGRRSFGGGAPPKLQEIKVLVKLAQWEGYRVEKAQDVERLMTQPAIEGVVVNAIEKLSDEDAKILRQRYPGTSPETAWIVAAGRPLRSGSAFVAIGVACALAAVGCVAFRFTGKR